MNTIKTFKEIAAPYIGSIVITESWKLGKLLDVIDGDDDYYYVIIGAGGETIWHSCVGRFIGLKGKIDEEDYEKLEREWKLNEPFWKLKGITE